MPGTESLGVSLAHMPQVSTPNDPTPLARERGRSPAEIGKAFEAMFASLLIKQMRQSLEENTLFANDSGDVRGGMFDQFMGEHIAASGRLGIADMIRRQLEQRSARA